MNRTKYLIAPVLILIASIGRFSAEAATLPKANNTDNLNLTSSWSGGVVPGSGDVALWDGTVTGANSVVLGANASWQGLSLTSPGGAVTIGAGNTLTLGTSGIDLSTASQNLTISSGLALGSGNQTWTVATGRTLTQNTGTFTRNAGATLVVDKSSVTGTVTAGPTLVNSVVPWAFVKSSGTAANNSANGYTFATVTSGNVVAYTGATAMSGTGAWGGIPSGGAGTINYDISSAGTLGATGLSRSVNTIRYTGTGATQPGNVNSTADLLTVNSILNAGTGELFVGGVGGSANNYGVNVTAGAEKNLVLGAMTANLTLRNIIKNNGAGASAVTVMGSSKVTLSGANTFTGDVFVNGGTLAANLGNNSLNPTASALGNPQTSGRTINVNNGGTLLFQSGDTLGSANSTVVATLVVNSGGLVTNTTGVFNTFGPVQLNGGTINGAGGAVAGYQMYNLRGTVTVGGSSMSTIAGSGSFAGYHLAAPTTFNVADVTSGTDLLVSGSLTNRNATDGGLGALTKTGAGTMTLSGVNTYGGATTISAGTLALSGTGTFGTSPVITVASGATLDVSGVSGGYTLGASQTLVGSGAITGDVTDSSGSTIFPGDTNVVGALTFNNNLALAGGDTWKFDFTASTNDNVVVGGNLTPGGTTTINLASLPPGGLANGAHTLFKVAGTLGGATNNFVITGKPSPSRQTFDIAYDTSSTPNKVLLLVGGGAANLVWQGGTGGNLWDVTNTVNWLNGVSSDVYFDGDSVSFTDAGSANPPVLNLTVQPGLVIFNSANPYTLSGTGNISGSASLTKSGNGTLTLSTATNDYTGITALNGGTVSIATIANGGVASPIGKATSASANLTFNGGTLQYTGATASTDRGATLNANGGAVEVSNSSATLAAGGAIVGTSGGGLTKSGSGTLALSGANTYDGTTTISAGTLQVGAGGTSGTLGAGNVINNAALAINRSDTATVNNTITGTGGLVKLGAGALSLGGANTYSGGTLLSVGSLNINHADALGTGSLLITNLASQAVLASGLTVTNPITISGPAGTVGTGAIKGPASGSATLTGPVTFTALTPNGGTTTNGGAFDGGNNTGGLIVSGAINSTAGGAIHHRANRLTLSGGGSYPAFFNSGTLVLGADNGVAPGAVLEMGSSAPALFDLAGFNQTLNGLQKAVSAATITNSGGASSTLFITGAGTNTTFAGNINDNGVTKINLSVNGGTFTLTGANTFTGDINVNGGTVVAGYTIIGNPIAAAFGNEQVAGRIISAAAGTTISLAVNDVFGNASANASLLPSIALSNATLTSVRFNQLGNLTLGSGSTLTQNNTTDTGVYQQYQFLGTVTVTGNAASAITSANFKGNHLGANTTFDVADVNGDANTDLTVTAPLLNQSGNYGGGPGSLTKTGTGTMTLGGTNTYTGATTINNGTLALGAVATFASTNINVGAGATFDVSAGGLTLAANQTLRGNGTVVGTLASSGRITPGASIGTLTFATAPTLNSEGVIVAELDRTNSPNADKIIVTSGALTFGGTLTITNIAGTPQNGDMFDLFDGMLAGAFATINLPPGGAAHWNTSDLNVGGTITFTNANPVASNFDLGVAVGGSAAATVIGKFVAATDADGDTVTISSVSTPASGTATIVGGTNITYTSTATAGSDSFTYTVSDGLGGVDTKTVTVLINSPEGFNKLSGPTDIGGGQYQLEYLGIPGQQYAIEETSSLAPPIIWTPRTTNAAAANGALTFIITPANPAGYFRTRSIP